MKIYHQLNDVHRDPNTVLTIGTFDGLHLGHQEILKKLFERSKAHNCRSFLVTFHPHPRMIVSKSNNLKILSTPEEKIEMLQKLGLENLLILNFTKEFSQQSPDEFIKNIIVDRIGLREIVIGYDHKFGKGREGTFETLKTLAKLMNFDVSMVGEFKLNGETVNSTKIRQAIIEGDIIKANYFLGRVYSFSGTVVVGDKRGRQLGYPTANVKLDDSAKLLPALGIYAANVIVDDASCPSLLSIGRRPTFYNDGEIVPEAYIYDFDQDIYDKRITVQVLERIRKEEKFSSPEELINQMHKDRAEGLKIFSELNSRQKQKSFSS